MNTAVALPTEFKDVMREKILSAFMGMIPQDKIDELVSKEITAFFDTEVELVISETPASLKKRAGSSYSSSTTLPTSFSIDSKITPFRQLVWSTIHEFIQPKIAEIVKDVKGQANKELESWLVEEAKPVAGATFKAIFTETAKSMSQQMFYKTMQYSIQQSHMNMMNALAAIGVDYSKASLIHPILTPTATNI